MSEMINKKTKILTGVSSHQEPEIYDFSDDLEETPTTPTTKNLNPVPTFESIGRVPLKHRYRLTEEFRESFIHEWNRLVDVTFGFRFMLNHPNLSQLWYWGICALIFSLLKWESPANACIGFFFGALLNQFMFVYSHMMAHAEWLYIYEDPRLWRQWTYDLTNGFIETRAGIKFWAFYHHHGGPNIKYDWYHPLGNDDAETSLHAHLIHLQIYTFYFQPHKLAWALFAAYFLPSTIGWFVLGFNLSGFYLWMGHDWTHSKALEISCIGGTAFNIIMSFWSLIRLNAKREDHFAHHVHNHKRVYVDFSIGETFFPWAFDQYFQSQWDWCFDSNTNENGTHVNFLTELGNCGNRNRRNMYIVWGLAMIAIQYFLEESFMDYENGWYEFAAFLVLYLTTPTNPGIFFDKPNEED